VFNLVKSIQHFYERVIESILDKSWQHFLFYFLVSGKVNSLFGVCEALMPLVYGPMYSYVYSATIRTAPGSFFILGGALTSPAVVIFG